MEEQQVGKIDLKAPQVSFMMACQTWNGLPDFDKSSAERVFGEFDKANIHIFINFIKVALAQWPLRFRNLKDAIARQDAPQVKMCAHQVRGGSSLGGAMKLTQQSLFLETETSQLTPELGAAVVGEMEKSFIKFKDHSLSFIETILS